MPKPLVRELLVSQIRQSLELRPIALLPESVLEAAHWYDAVATEHNLGVLSAPQLAALQTSHLRILQQLQRASTMRLRELKLAARRPKSGGAGGGAED